MKARDIIEEYIKLCGIDKYSELTIYETDLEVEFTRRGNTIYKIKNEDELIKLKAILTLMEIDFGLID